MNTSKVLSCLFIVVLFLGCKTKEAATPKESIVENPFAFDFVQSDLLTTVLDQAKDEKKLVFVEIYTDWCLPCKMMEEDVFTHEETAAVINKDFISYRVNAEKGEGPDINVIYEVKSYPTLLFLDDRGNVLTRKKGAAYHTELLGLANSAVVKNSGMQ